MALIDSFNRVHNYLRLSLTSSCNFKCSYCYSSETPKESVSVSFLMRLVSLFAAQGVTKVRLTGGEPLIHPKILEIAKSVKQVKGINHLAITTNGLLLRRHLPGLLSAGLNSINLSLDSLIPAKFAFISKVDGFSKVWQGFNECLGKVSLKLNCVAMKGVNDDEILDFIELAKDREISVRFIEFVPYTGNQWEDKRFISHEDILKVISQKYAFRRILENDPIAKYYKIDGFAGSFGVIGSISEPFCDRCDRLRITADGKFKVCLNSPQEVTLDEQMTDEELLKVIKLELWNKPKEHGGVNNMIGNGNRPMIAIGG